MGSYGVRDENFRNCWFVFVMGILCGIIAEFGYLFYTIIMHRNVDSNIWNIIQLAVRILPGVVSIGYGFLSIRAKEDVKIWLIILFIVLNIVYMAIGFSALMSFEDFLFNYVNDSFNAFYQKYN